MNGQVHTPLLAPLAALVLTLACVASEGPQQVTQRESLLSQLVADMSDLGLALRAFSVRDTVRVGDPIQIVYFVVNSEGPREFHNSPDMFGFRVESEDGHLIQPHSGGSNTRAWGASVEHTLPARAALAQLIDIGCIYPAYNSGERSGCEYGFTLERPGEYKVIVSYQRGDPALHRPDFEPVSLSDTVAIIIR